MDGHEGYHTSRLLSRILIKGVALELSALTTESNSRPQSGLFGRLQSLLWSTHPQSPNPLDSDPHRVSLAIQDAFAKLDAELIEPPIRILANSLDEESRKMKKVPDLSKHPLALTSMLPAFSGTVSLFTPHNHVFQLILSRQLYINGSIRHCSPLSLCCFHW
jgi:pyruvate dehydrogenase phosphatase